MYPVGEFNCATKSVAIKVEPDPVPVDDIRHPPTAPISLEIAGPTFKNGLANPDCVYAILF